MATIIVSFDSEQEAKDAVGRLAQADIGEVRARVLDSSEPLSYKKDDFTSPMITPELGSVEVRPTETPEVPEAMHEDPDANVSANVPTTGAEARGVQVMIEVSDDHEEEVRRLLTQKGPGGK